MPRLPEQNRAIKDRRRQKLMDAAIKVFVSRGYDDTTVDNITKAAKCSHGLFYHYFQKMEDIFRAIYYEVILPSPIAELTTVYDDLHGAEGLRLLTGNVEKAQALSGKDLTILLAIMVFLDSKTVDRAETDVKERFDIHPVISRLLAEGQQEGTVIEGDLNEIEDAFYTLVKGCLIRKKYCGCQSKTVTGLTLLRLLLRVSDSAI